MFRGFFGFRSIKDESKRKQIYTISKEEQLEKEKKRKYEQEQVDLKNKFLFRKELLGRKIVGLKIRIDSNKALKEALLSLIEVLKNYQAQCTFFVSSGKAGLGESPFALINPLWLREVIKSQQLKIEGYENVFSGILFPSKEICQNGEAILTEIKEKGFDLGSGCFSPPKWIQGVLKRNEDLISQLYNRSIDEFEKVFKIRCTSFSAPSFFCSNATMLEKENFYFDFSSDCRGMDPFFPVIDTRVLKTPQVPVTLPLMSEWFCAGNGNAQSYFNFLLDEIAKQKYPVYEIQPLYEGVSFKKDFEDFLKKAAETGIVFVSLRELLGLRIAEDKPLPRCTLSYGLVEGRRRFATIQMFEV
jgi:undecaprenyl phosphate-alpha-L-ara4FN deformylase